MDAPNPSNPTPPNPPTPDKQRNPAGAEAADPGQAPEPAPEVASPPAERVIRGGDMLSMLVGGLVYVFVAGCGVLHILAATKIWNPFYWQGQLWTGVFMVAAPTAVALMAGLPYRVRQRMPESVVTVGILALWIAFFWAACGGH